MIKRKYLFAALAALALAAPAAKAEFYWLVSGLDGKAYQRCDADGVNGKGSWMVLTNDVEGVEYNPIKIYDIRRTVANGTTLAIYSDARSILPYEGCPNGGADIDLTLPIRDANGGEYTLVELGNQCFEDCNYVGSVKFPATMEKIGTFAFRRAKYMKSAEFPADTSAITTLGAQIFDSCTSLEGYFVWPSQIKEVGNHTFIYTKIQGFYGPAVTNVGNSAFNSCTSLTALEFGASVEFGPAVFQNTKKTTGVGYNVLFHDAPPVIDSNNYLIGGSNGVLDWWGNGTFTANATVYVPFNAAKDGPTEKWKTFKDDFEKAVTDNLITWPTDNGDGTWTDGSIYAKLPNKTVRLRFWDPDATTTSALLAY